MDHSVNEQQPGESSNATEDNRLLEATKSLRRHLGLAETPGGNPPQGQTSRITVHFWVECTPRSSRGAKCQLGCSDTIMRGQYRIAVHLGGRLGYSNVQSPDYYHIQCFEKFADFSRADFLDRVLPLTRNFMHKRHIKRSTLINGKYLLDGGAERLVIEWKLTMGKLIDKRDGVGMEALNPAFNDLLQKSGSSKYVPTIAPGMTKFEFDTLSNTVAPIESDGPEDPKEWNLFEEYLSIADDNEDDLKDRHSLSKCSILATSANLSETGKREKGELTPKALKAIRRLAAIPSSDL